LGLKEHCSVPVGLVHKILAQGIWNKGGYLHVLNVPTRFFPFNVLSWALGVFNFAPYFGLNEWAVPLSQFLPKAKGGYVSLVSTRADGCCSSICGVLLRCNLFPYLKKKLVRKLEHCSSRGISTQFLPKAHAKALLFVSLESANQGCWVLFFDVRFRFRTNAVTDFFNNGVKTQLRPNVQHE